MEIEHRNVEVNHMLRRFVIVHLVTPYLFHTGSWVYNQIKNLELFENYVFTQSAINLDIFPFENLISADRFCFSKKLLNRLYRKLTNRYGLFFSKYIFRISPSIIHAHMGYEGVRWLSFVRRNKIPLVTSFYGLDLSQLGKSEYWRKKYQFLFEYGSLFFVEGSFSKNQLKLLGCPEDKIKVVHLGIDVNKYMQKDSAKNNKLPVIIQVSSYREKKGIEYSLAALSLVKKKNINFVFKLIGSGNDNYVKKIKDLIVYLNLEENVQLLGALTHDQVKKEVLESDIFLHPSITADDGDNEGGAPVILIEASAMGLPIVSTIHADIPEVVLNGVSGLLVKEKDEVSLSEGVIKLIGDKKLCFQMGQEGRKHISSNYSVIKQIEQQSIFYNSIISGSIR